ncbi:hypothetical protein PM082_009021 [Marasmius tenuissimus]|nr:hypothetical protein PM082_009021 [Marasmius tenuissimus]
MAVTISASMSSLDMLTLAVCHTPGITTITNTSTNIIQPNLDRFYSPHRIPAHSLASAKQFESIQQESNGRSAKFDVADSYHLDWEKFGRTFARDADDGSFSILKITRRGPTTWSLVLPLRPQVIQDRPGCRPGFIRTSRTSSPRRFAIILGGNHGVRADASIAAPNGIHSRAIALIMDDFP